MAIPKDKKGWNRMSHAAVRDERKLAVEPESHGKARRNKRGQTKERVCCRSCGFFLGIIDIDPDDKYGSSKREKAKRWGEPYFVRCKSCLKKANRIVE